MGGSHAPVRYAPVMAAERPIGRLGAWRHRIASAASAASLCFCVAALLTGSAGPRELSTATAAAMRGAGRARLATPMQGVVHMLSHLGDILSNWPGMARSAAARPEGARVEELAQGGPHYRLRSVVTMLSSEVKTPGVCDKKDKIFEILTGLMEKLGGRASTVNATDATYKKEAETGLKVWLEVETLYRMSEEKYDEATESEQFVMHQLEVAQRVEELTKKDVATVIEEYPGKKDEINEEKSLVVELIKMVENITFSGPGEDSSKAAPTQLNFIGDEIRDLEDRSKPLKLKAEFAQLQNVKNQLASIGTGFTAPQTTKLGVTMEDVQVTKSAVIKILMELLKEPDFRDHLLELGLKAAHAQMKKDSEEVTELEKKEVKLGSIADKAQNEVAVTEMERNKDAGDKLSKEQAFVNEHKEFVAQTESNVKAKFIIETIIEKINAYCNGVDQAGADQPQPTGAAAKAAIRPLLAAAQAAAEAAWRTGGDR